MNLYELTVDADEKVSQYRSPNIDEWVKAIDPVLKASGENTIGRDKVDSITVSNDTIYILTSYSVRGCSQNNEIEIPVFIIKADNPIFVAKKYKLSKALDKAKIDLKAALNKVYSNTQSVSLLESELAALNETQEQQP